VGGSVPLEAGRPDKVRNSCLIYDQDGKLAARYDKIHLFGFTKGSESYNESKTIVPGRSVATVEKTVGTVGMSGCYDPRFPEPYRAMGPGNPKVGPAPFTVAWTRPNTTSAPTPASRRR